MTRTSPSAPPSDGPPLRVLVATTVHTPHDARILHRQIAAMVQAGWSVTYVAPWTPEHTAPPGVTTVGVPRAVGRRRLVAALAARRQLARLAPEHDVVLVHDLDLLPVAWSVRRARPLVWDVHEDTAAALSDRRWVAGPLRPLLRIVVRQLERSAERRFTLLLAETSYQARFRRRHHIVPNLPWARSERHPRRAEDRAVYVGRLSEGRGLHAMIEVGRELRGRVEVLLIGAVDRTDEAALRAAVARGWVRWLGPLPNDEALVEVQGSVAGLSLLRDEPNYRGSMPTKVVEYLAAGVPAVTTPLPEARRIVSAHEAGIVVPFGSTDAVVSAVLDLAQDHDRWDAVSAAGFRAARDELSWDREVPGFLDALRDAGKRRRSPDQDARPTS